ncbi:hypothetical protein TNCV_3883481 [Trichonephila clavipes]|nr:hypothetical protein TNCV_3883481 [Trichonephila clavipes]
MFEHLSEILGIRHVKTVVYRSQANRIERVKRDLVQMVANYVNDQHNSWDQLLLQFAYAVRTAVNETTGKKPCRIIFMSKIDYTFSEISDGIEQNGICRGPERKFRKGSDHRVPKRALSSNYTTNSNLPKFRKMSRREETVASSTSGYNLKPRGGRGVEFRLAMEMKTHQGGPVRVRKSKEKNYNLYTSNSE